MVEVVSEVIPSVGRIVHYVSYGSVGGKFPKTCRAAIVTQVDPDDSSLISLMVANPTGLFFNQRLPFAQPGTDSQDIEGGTWHWAERV